jgi:hypothetical protein
MNRTRPTTRMGIYPAATGIAIVVAVFLTPISVQAYEVVDTGVSGRNEVYWIDNARVLFPGYEKSSATAERTSVRSVLYVLDLGTKRPTVHSEIPEGGYVCYASGHVRYAVSKDGKRYMREGKFGAEIERELAPSPPGSKIDRNEFTCKDVDLSTADKMYPGFLFIPLRDGHGYYGWQKEESSAKGADASMFFLPAGMRTRPIALPIKSSEKRRMSYSEYMGAYVIERSELTRKDVDGRPSGKVWLLFPTGKVSEAEMPNGPWLRATWGYAPTRKGWSVSSRATGVKSNFDPGDAGIYLVNGNVAKRLVVGFPSTPAVSPDGCKIAAVVNPLIGPGLRATLRIIDLCK